jgi:hypothetical protein
MTWPWVRWSGIVLLAGSRDFSFLQYIQICSGALPASYYAMGTGVLSPDIKQPGYKVDQRLSISNFMKNHPTAIFMSKHLVVRQAGRRMPRQTDRQTDRQTHTVAA